MKYPDKALLRIGTYSPPFLHFPPPTGYTDGLRIVSQPLPSPFYVVADTVAYFPCLVQECVDDTDQTISSLLYRNSIPLSLQTYLPRHHLSFDGDGNVIGLLILGVQASDSGVVVRCSAVRDGVEVLSLRDTTIIVGGE